MFNLALKLFLHFCIIFFHMQWSLLQLPLLVYLTTQKKWEGSSIGKTAAERVNSVQFFPRQRKFFLF